MDRKQFRLDFGCIHCGTQGAIVWEENAAAGPRQRRLVSIDGEFHAETGRSRSGDPLIVCNICDTIQPD